MIKPHNKPNKRIKFSLLVVLIIAIIAALNSAEAKMHTTTPHFIMYDDPNWLNAQITAFIKEKS